jgi:ELWxxDGT repeat protein
MSVESGNPNHLESPMKALVAMSLFLSIAACTRPDGKGSAEGDEVPASGEESGTTETGAGTTTGAPDTGGKNAKDVATESGGNSSTSGSTTDSGSSSGNDSGSTPSTTADTDIDGVTDDKDVCPGEDDALQVTRYKLTDADQDSYADGSQSATVCPSNTEYTLTLPQVIYSDCNSSDATQWQMLAYSHRDTDGDGHSIASSGSICSGSALPSGYLNSTLGTTDCDDTNGSYHTVATYYSYVADAITADRYNRLSESKCVPTAGYASVNSYKEYRLAPEVISTNGLTDITSFYEFGGKLYFGANNGTDGTELWVTDGTLAGTSMIKDIFQGPDYGTPDHFMSAGGKLFFTADDGAGVYQLWNTDGTDAGTVKVKAIAPSSFTAMNGLLFFVASNGPYGVELWKTDGTTAGTVIVKDIRTGSASSSPASLTNVNGTLFFTADDDGSGHKDLWKTDGTDAGTQKVKDLDNASGTPLVAVDGTLFFTAKLTGYGRELWKSDGTTNGTVMVKDIRVGNGDGFVETAASHFASINGFLYFVADDGTSGKELWKSDGTDAGTVMVKDIWSGTNFSTPDNLINVNGTLFFTADNGIYGTELWKSNGTEAGTTMVKDINANGSIDLLHPTAVGAVLYFTADDGTHGNELWKSDGTETGTLLTKDIHPLGSSSPSSLTVFNNRLVFVATTSDGLRIHITPAAL